jgi:hypothetical protein
MYQTTVPQRGTAAEMSPGLYNSTPSADVSSVSWEPNAEQLRTYEALFSLADSSNRGNIGGREAVLFFKRSGLDVDMLKTVCFLLSFSVYLEIFC